MGKTADNSGMGLRGQSILVIERRPGHADQDVAGGQPVQGLPADAALKGALGIAIDQKARKQRGLHARGSARLDAYRRRVRTAGIKEAAAKKRLSAQVCSQSRLHAVSLAPKPIVTIFGSTCDLS
jgi:hypothetical protein